MCVFILLHKKERRATYYGCVIQFFLLFESATSWCRFVSPTQSPAPSPEVRSAPRDETGVADPKMSELTLI